MWCAVGGRERKRGQPLVSTDSVRAAMAVVLTLLLTCAFAGFAFADDYEGPEAETEIEAEAEAGTEAETGLEPEALEASAAAIPYKSDISDANLRQLVLVVRFKGDTAGDGDTGWNAPYTYSNDVRTRWERSLEELNGLAAQTVNLPTVYSYLKQVSLGKCRLESVSPQFDASTGRVAYLTLSKSRTEYGSDESVVSEALQLFNASYGSYDARVLDGNGDGFVDNVLVVPEVPNGVLSYGGVLWPKQINIAPASVGASGMTRKVSNCTIVSSSYWDVGTIAHETLHVLGAHDLYRGVSTAGDPVGVWDIMATHSGSKLMWPLAITRQNCGWLTIPETTATEVTLYAPASGKTQAVKVRTGLSASEYFVIEYRKATSYLDGNLSALDVSSDSAFTIGGSGAIVYRVNESVNPSEGNKGDRDYVYLFREGETGGPRGDGVATRLRWAHIGNKSRASIGVADLSKGLSNGAITYSNGQNSGLVVSLKSQTDDSITLSIAYPNTKASDLWSEALNANGSTPLSSATATGVLVEGEGSAAYQLCVDYLGKLARAFAYNGSTWSSLGTVGAGCQAFDTACVGGTLYVAGINYSNSSVTLWSWSGSSWVQRAKVSGAPSYARLASVGNTPYLFVPGNTVGGTLYRLSGTSLVAVGSALGGGNLNACEILDVGGSPVLVYSDFDARAVKLARLQSNTWNTASLASQHATVLDAIKVGTLNYLLAVPNGGTATTYKVDANGVATVLRQLPSPAVPFAAAITGGDGILYVAASSTTTGGLGKTEVYQMPLDGSSTWKKLGHDVTTSYFATDLCLSGSRVYCATSDSMSSRAQLHYYAALSHNPSTGQTPSTPGTPGSSSGSGASDSKPSTVWKVATMPKVTDKVYNGVLQIGVPQTNGVVVIGGSATRVGTYTASVTPAAGYAWNAKGDRSVKKVSWRILSAPSVAYSTHVQNIGWQKEVRDGARGGTAGRALRVEAFRVRLVNQPYPGGIRVRAHVQNVGWQGWAEDGAVSGTSGRALRVEALQIELTGEMARHYDVYYCAHVQNVGDTGWAKNGGKCGSAGRSWRMEAVYIRLVPKGGAAPGSTAGAFVHPMVSYRAHVQNVGWQAAVSDGATGGTSGRSLRVEAFRVSLVEQPCPGGIEVSSHVQNIGWQGWRGDGATSGTSGRSLRVEALKVRLTGEMAERYDVYYRTHCQNVGWTGWARNGVPSGTAGYAYRMEAVQIKLVPKGGAAPGPTARSFYQKK